MEKEKELTYKRNRWITGLRFMLAINIIWQIGNITAAIVLISNDMTLREFSGSGMFLFLRLSGDIATICFMIAGLVLSAKVRELPRTTVYEMAIASKQKEALRRLW